MTVKFNEQQKQAIEHHTGSCAVIAGAGSGKSTVLVNRIKNLIDTYKVDQKEILAISFTRNTADELKNKLNKMGYLNVNIGTFHSVCGKILVQEGINITNQNLIKDWQKENCFKKIDEKADVNDIASFISYQKNYLRSYKDEFVYKESSYKEEELRKFYKAYELMKSKEGFYDLDDYLTECYKVLKNNPGKYTYEFVLVDEHQDSNLVQNLLLKELCVSGNMFCVFDFRQAIFSFRGGNTDYCMNFDKWWDNPTVINLDMNYRSTKNVVDKANGFIKKYYGDYKHYSDSIPHNRENGKIEINTYYERESEGKEIADKIETLIQSGEKPSQIVVLYRLNSHSSYVEYELKKRDIEYVIANDSSFFKRKEIAGIISYLRLLQNPHDDSAFETIFKLRNYPLQFFSDKIYGDIKKHAALHNQSYYESLITMRFPNDWQGKNATIFENNINKLRLQKDKSVDLITLIDNVSRAFQIDEYVKNKYSNKEEVDERLQSIQILKTFVKGHNIDSFVAYVYSGNNSNNKKGFKKDAVKLMSIHASKGLEFKHVFLIGVEDGKFPHEKSDLLDEARLFYVGVTRSKENLYLSQIYEDNQFISEYQSKVN